MKYLFFFLSLSLCNDAIAQGENEQIKADFQKYANALKSRQYTQATSYMPETLFKTISREQVVQEIKNTFESEETEVKINGIEVTGFGNKISADGAVYVPFDFTQNFEIKYPNLFDATDDEQSRDSTTKFIVQMLNETMPESTVSFNKTKEVFVVNSSKKAIAIKLNSKDSWKFLVVENSIKNRLGSFLPAAVIQKIKL